MALLDRRSVRPGVGLIVASLSLGCPRVDAFLCTDDAQCDLQPGQSVCLADGACGYADPDCDSGLRRSAEARTNPSVCVPTESGSSTGLGTEESSSTTLPMSTGETSSSDETCGELAWYPDGDGDGFGDANAVPEMACEQPMGKLPSGDDCDDADPRVRPDHLDCEVNPSMVAWFRLDDLRGPTVADSSGSARDGGALGVPGFGEAGAFGTAVRLSVPDDRIEILSAVEALAVDGTPPLEGTIELWALPDVLDEACVGNCVRIALHISDANGDGFGGNTPDLHVHAIHDDAGTPYHWGALLDEAEVDARCQINGPDLEYDRWTHLALSWNAERCTLYIDGMEYGSSMLAAPITAPWTEGRIGHPPSRPDRAFPGAIDEVMIFAAERTIEEIRADCGRDPCVP